jgi:hypothetical protein
MHDPAIVRDGAALARLVALEAEDQRREEWNEEVEAAD